MRVFVAVVEQGSLSAAARSLHASQSAVSQTIQTLERQLGHQLFERGRNGVTLTTVGAKLEDAARTMLATHDRVLDELSSVEAAPAVRLGVPLEFPTGRLTAVLAQLAKDHPDYRVDLHHASSASQWTALREGALDVALVRDRSPDPDFDAVLAVREAMGVILAEHTPVRLLDGAVPLQELVGLSWVAFARSDTPVWWDQVSATLRGHGIAVPTDPDSHQPVTPEVKLAAVAAGRTFALASPTWAQPLPERLVWRPLAHDPIVRRTWAVWRSDSTRRDLAALVDALDSEQPPSG